jgi:two-component system sensor histidine kinase HydH
MIIKASLRTLRREDVTAAETREAATDIDEEVVRLNRVVNEVLDFARPIRFDLAPVDVNRLCADCANATVADGQEPGIRVETDPGTGSIVTDGERLRIALVNILTNARQAVLARAGGNGAGDRPDVQLRVGRGHDGRVHIQVSDRGTGISEDDLPRVFDPYFTTRRTGNGLGLAISKNIIDGLGGTITVNSRPDEGTAIRIELPTDVQHD